MCYALMGPALLHGDWKIDLSYSEPADGEMYARAFEQYTQANVLY
jgi:hypothetical protein